MAVLRPSFLGRRRIAQDSCKGSNMSSKCRIHLSEQDSVGIFHGFPMSGDERKRREGTIRQVSHRIFVNSLSSPGTHLNLFNTFLCISLHCHHVRGQFYNGFDVLIPLFETELLEAFLRGPYLLFLHDLLFRDCLFADPGLYSSPIPP